MSSGRVLARHDGFIDEELGFITHYDIKYRMGRDGDIVRRKVVTRPECGVHTKG